jgi:hypothetical protein
MNKSLLITLSEEDLAHLIREAVDAGVTAALARVKEQQPTNGHLLTRGQLAAHLKVSPYHVSKLVARGMPCYGVSSHDRRFRLADCEAWLATRHAA